MSSYDDFLRECKVFDEFHTLLPSKKLKWRELYEDSKKTLATSGISPTLPPISSNKFFYMFIYIH